MNAIKLDKQQRLQGTQDKIESETFYYTLENIKGFRFPKFMKKMDFCRPPMTTICVVYVNIWFYIC